LLIRVLLVAPTLARGAAGIKPDVVADASADVAEFR
jgi:hypothetical protein